MKIALINSEHPTLTGADHGGIATYTYSMARALAEQGHKVHVFIRNGTIPPPLPPAVNVHTYSYKQFVLRTKRILDSIKDGQIRWEQGHARDIRDSLLAIHNAEGLDIAEFPEYGGLAGECGQSQPFATVINFHMPSVFVDKLNSAINTERKRWHKFEATSIKRVHGYRTPSEAMKKEVCQLYNIKGADVKVIRNPVYTEYFDKIKKHHQEKRFDLLFAGRLEHRKGADLLLNSIKDILQIDTTVHVTIAGETTSTISRDYRVAIENTLNEEQRSRIWFLGALSFEQLAILYCRSSAFLFPSHFENGPYALYEAIAAKLPVIASAAGGTLEIIKHRESGLLFSCDKPQELINAIKLILQNKDIHKVHADAAYRDLCSLHAPPSIARETELFYESIISKYRKQ